MSYNHQYNYRKIPTMTGDLKLSEKTMIDEPAKNTTLDPALAIQLEMLNGHQFLSRPFTTLTQVLSYGWYVL